MKLLCRRCRARVLEFRTSLLAIVGMLLIVAAIGSANAPGAELVAQLNRVTLWVGLSSYVLSILMMVRYYIRYRPQQRLEDVINLGKGSWRLAHK